MFKCATHWLFQFLFIDQDKKQMSHTKFWGHIGYACMCYTFVYAVIYGTKVDYMIWFLFGLVVIGNRSLLKLVTRNDVNPPKE